MTTPLRPIALAAIVALSATASRAAYQLDVFAPPNNTPLVAISGSGPPGVSTQSGIGNVYLASAPGSFIAIGGNSATAGFASGLGISGDGLRISGIATAGNGFSQAAVHDVNIGTLVGIQVARLSDSGVWAAGGSVNGLATNHAPTGSFPTITFSPATLWNTQTNSGVLIPYDHVIDTAVGGTDLIRNMKASVAGVSDQGTVIGSFNQCLSCSTGILQ